MYDCIFFFVDPTTRCLFFLPARDCSLSPLTKPNHCDFSSRWPTRPWARHYEEEEEAVSGRVHKEEKALVHAWY